ncbi:M14 family metallopeptidase [Streptomyces avicenniae]|uniref:M14 family metallopeptidase n=1 Tax=Streptomyces avicenniae TaxID=500153 RepID=UPI000699BEB6|nr:M14 family metallopeptidase [Streptomyces avicenniae]
MRPFSRTTSARRARTAAAALVALALAAGLGTQATASPSGPPTVQQWEVTGLDSATERTALTRTGTAIDEVRPDSVVITAGDADVRRLRSLGYELSALPGTSAADVRPTAPSDYHTYAATLAEINAVRAQYPSLVTTRVIGRSYQGRDIVAVKVSANAATDEAEPEVLFTHNQHAREHLTVEMALRTLNVLTSGYGSNARITQLLNSREVWIIPSANPDGKVYDQESGSFRSWRKNRQPTPGSSLIGTDLNRNWNYRWGCCGGSSSSPGSETYRGPSAESGTETRVVADFVRGRRVGGVQQITAHIDFHTYGELVLWPYGYTYNRTGPGLTADDAAAFEALGEEMAGSNGYTPQQSSDLYITDGSINDWLWGDQGIFSYTFEMYPRGASGGGFYPPGNVIARETARNDAAVLLLLEYADCVYRITGQEDTYC